MKNKKSLFGDMMKVVLLFAIAGLSPLYAMDFSLVASSEQRPIDRNVALRGFLSNSFSRMSVKANENQSDDSNWLLGKTKASDNILLEKIKKEMSDRFVDPADRSLVMLFNFATLLPELQNKIAGQLLGETNSLAVKNFLIKPMGHQIPRCVFSHMIADKKALPRFVWNAFDQNDPRSLQVSTIFESLEDVITVDKIMQVGLQKHCYNRKELAALDNVLRLFPFVGRSNQNLWLKYTYRDAYTLSNVIRKINEAQCFGLVVLGIPCISACIEQEICTKVLVPHLAELNGRNMIKNEAIIAKFQELGEQLLPGDLSKMVDPLKHSWLNYAKIMAPHVAMGPSFPLILQLFDRDNESVRLIIMRMLKEFKSQPLPTICAIAVGMIPFLFFQALFFAGSWAASSWDLSVLESWCDDRLAIHGCLLGGYVLGCLLYNVRSMSKMQNNGVRLESISTALNNKNIVLR